MRSILESFDRRAAHLPLMTAMMPNLTAFGVGIRDSFAMLCMYQEISRHSFRDVMYLSRVVMCASSASGIAAGKPARRRATSRRLPYHRPAILWQFFWLYGLDWSSRFSMPKREQLTVSIIPPHSHALR